MSKTDNTSSTDTVKVWNNVVFNFNTTLASYAIGITVDYGAVYIFNNTVYNCQTGIRKWNTETNVIEVKNNVSINNVSYAGYLDYRGLTLAPAATRANNVSSDARSETASLRNKTAYTTYFRNTTAGSKDLHLTSSSLVLWGSNGANLSADPNLPVTEDIDGEGRTRPDIGADEFQAGAIYYSVGTSTALLYNGNASAGAGTLTLASAAPSNVGVGDEICFGTTSACTTADRYYIRARLSPTAFMIQDSAANGGTPGATNVGFGSQRSRSS